MNTRWWQHNICYLQYI